MKIEKRIMPVDGLHVREADGGKSLRLNGYAAVFDKPSVPIYGMFHEYVRKGAFANSVAKDDIRSFWNHNADLVLARNKSGTLRLSEDSKGLEFDADLPNSEAGRNWAETVRRGDVDGMSFMFRTITDAWFMEDGKDARELKEVQLFEVGPVAFPAYPDTSVGARSIEDAGNLEKIGEALKRMREGGDLRDVDMETVRSALGQGAVDHILKIRGGKPGESVEHQLRHMHQKRLLELSLIEA